MDVIESDFIPLLVINNKAGADAKLLKKFKERAWNYQVVRFFDKNEADIIPLKRKIWSLQKLVPRIEKTLIAHKKPLSNSLKLLKIEADKSNHNTVLLGMKSFEKGELHIGAIEGVIKTEAGWYEGKELTKVVYHKKIITLENLINKAAKVNCADTLYPTKETDKDAAKNTKIKVITINTKKYRRADKVDQKKQLAGTNYASLTLSALQATKINAFIGSDPKKATTFLTRKQKKALNSQ